MTDSTAALQAPGEKWKGERRERQRESRAPASQSTGGVSMKLEHSTVVTSDGKKIVTSTWHTDSGKVTTTYVSGGKLLP
jgi:hypothetical protein